MGDGGLCAMMAGQHLMHLWYADSSATIHKVNNNIVIKVRYITTEYVLFIFHEKACPVPKLLHLVLCP